MQGQRGVDRLLSGVESNECGQHVPRTEGEYSGQEGVYTGSRCLWQGLQANLSRWGRRFTVLKGSPT